ncbi:MAG: hypothetical protein H5T92_00630 [Synergistales bacterium]|nr:hypothetical protein [Synergistales bacterium]
MWNDNVPIRIELSYEFEQSPNITVGDFVDTKLEDRWQASFFHNSGVKIEKRAEIQIFDTAALLDAIDGSQETLDGNVVTMQGDINDINTHHYVKLHYGDPPVPSTVTAADHVNALISGIPYRWEGLENGGYDDLVSAPMGGQTMIVEVTRDQNGDYDFTVTIGGGEPKQYHVLAGPGDPDSWLYLQSHWGSGVKFTSAKVRRIEP